MQSIIRNEAHPDANFNEVVQSQDFPLFDKHKVCLEKMEISLET